MLIRAEYAEIMDTLPVSADFRADMLEQALRVQARLSQATDPQGIALFRQRLSEDKAELTRIRASRAVEG